MRYTTNLNLPVAESGDPKKTYADDVDGPRTDILDTIGQVGGLVNRETDNLVMPSGAWTNIPFDRQLFLQGGLTFDGTYFTIPRNGIYVVTGAITVKEVSTSTTVYMAVLVNDGSTSWVDRFVTHRGHIAAFADSLTGAIN